MLFRRIITYALVTGMMSGLALTLIQLKSTSPIIIEAEKYEFEHSGHESDELATMAAPKSSHSHKHGVEAWSPDNGNERFFFTMISNIFASIAFATLLLVLMSHFQLMQITQINVLHGFLWGFGGFIAFYFSPTLGLPAEIPGVNTAPVEQRQLWWLATALLSTIGLCLLAYAKPRLKILAIVFLLLPHWWGAPQIAGPMISHPQQETVLVLSQLHEKFILTSTLVNLVYWVFLGVLCAWMLNIRVLKNIKVRRHEAQA